MKMKRYYFKQMAGFLALAGVLLASCGEDDIVEVFDTPTIAVTSDNDQPFQGDTVNFNITVNAPGGLESVTLNGTEIKEYDGVQTNDTFTLKYIVVEDATIGPVALAFAVSDAQEISLSSSFTNSITVQNSDFRGDPVLLADFQDDGNIASVTFDSGPNAWEAAYSTELGADDVVNPANKVLKANRLGACDWFFQGGGAVFVDFNNFLSEDEMLAIFNGDRVFQMNVFVEEKAKIVNAHDNPEDNANNRLEYDAAWNVNRFFSENPNAVMAWDYEVQDSAESIPLRIEVGNAAAWDFNGGDPLGKKFYLVGSVTETNTWKTITFSLLRNAGTDDELDLVANAIGSGLGSFADDPEIGFDQINRLAFQLNNRVSSYNNVDMVFQIPGNNNGWSSNSPISIADDHNSYYIDNIRIIDADEYNNNPNL
jgi:hypothetical protein